MRLTVNDVMKAGRARMPVGQPSTEFEGVSVDSRAVTPGSLFVGIRGDVSDGGQYAPEALRAGAEGVVVGEAAWMWIEGEAQALRKPVIVSPDPLQTLQAAGRLALERSGARVIAITGATGKTTTKDILIAMLLAAGARAEGTPGNHNTDVGVPISLLGLTEGTEIAVIEMGMRGEGQIAELAALAPPDVACITAIAPVHLELLGTVERVAAAKAEILRALRPGGVAVVPADEPLLEPHLAELPDGVEVVRFGPEPDLALNLSLDKAWQLANAAAALACCRAVGRVPAADARVEVRLSAMRGQERELPGGGRVIEDCYNANPLAMAAALRDLAGRSGRRVAVLGDMMELGADEARYHREVGALAAELRLDALIAVGERARWYLEAADGVSGTRFADAAGAAEGIGDLVEPGDVVLVKGSRSMALERVVGALLE